MNKNELLQVLKKRNFSDRIIRAFAKVRREEFILPDLQKLAYEDIALPVNGGATISQPSTIAYMLSMLKLHENQKVLEIGSGTGYALALLSEIAGERGKVFGVEVSEELAEKSKQTLESYKNIFIFNKNGKEGLREEAPFDRILISAALEKIPEAILEQLKENGIIVAPIGDFSMQTLTSMRKHKNTFFVIERLPGFIFVRFIE